MAQSVDEERGCPIHAAPNATHEILVHPIGVDVLGELLVEQVEIEVERLSVGAEIIVREVSLVLVQMIVHLPEPALRSRGFGCLGRALGVGMRAIRLDLVRPGGSSSAEYVATSYADLTRYLIQEGAVHRPQAREAV